MEKKMCSICKQVKPISEFYKNKESADGKHNSCKLCYNERYNIHRYFTNKKYHRLLDVYADYSAKAKEYATEKNYDLYNSYNDRACGVLIALLEITGKEEKEIMHDAKERKQ